MTGKRKASGLRLLVDPPPPSAPFPPLQPEYGPEPDPLGVSEFDDAVYGFQDPNVKDVLLGLVLVLIFLLSRGWFVRRCDRCC